jgi:hypothetical protein
MACEGCRKRREALRQLVGRIVFGPDRAEYFRQKGDQARLAAAGREADTAAAAGSAAHGPAGPAAARAEIEERG